MDQFLPAQSPSSRRITATITTPYDTRPQAIRANRKSISQPRTPSAREPTTPATSNRVTTPSAKPSGGWSRWRTFFLADRARSRGRRPRQKHVYASIWAKKSGPGRELHDHWEDCQEALPCPLRQQRLHPGLRPLPRGPRLFELRHPGSGDLEPFLAAVLTGPDGHPAPLHEGAEVARQRRLVQRCQPTQVPLPDLARTAELAEQGILGTAQADAAQLLVVEPADGPRRLTQGVAKAEGGGQLVALGRDRQVIPDGAVISLHGWALLLVHPYPTYELEPFASIHDCSPGTKRNSNTVRYRDSGPRHRSDCDDPR